MGGQGSGVTYWHWWRPAKKTTVEDSHSIEANRWMREGILKGGVHLTGLWQWTYRNGGEFSVNYEVHTLDAENPWLRLWYSWRSKSTGQAGSEDYSIGLTTTRPRFGGLRWWFVCPLVVRGRSCGRRVGKLYLPPGTRYFGCRRCHDLTYTSCQESCKYDRVWRMLAEGTGYDPAFVKRAMNSIGKRR
jgi:hypothetical protein